MTVTADDVRAAYGFAQNLASDPNAFESDVYKAHSAAALMMVEYNEAVLRQMEMAEQKIDRRLSSHDFTFWLGERGA